MSRIGKALAVAFIALSLGLPWCSFHASPLIKGESYAFRDSAHYYYPLWQLVASTWRGGLKRAGTDSLEPPLWNPNDNGGQPLAADATACVFYPGTLLLLAPLPFALAFKLSLGIHAAGAAFSMLFAARRLGHSWSAAALAAISYAFGGYVVAQHANVVYLIGAAWLPLALYFGERTLQTGQWIHGTALAAALAMIVLGGDPQTAYHIVLALLILALYQGIASTGNRLQPRNARRCFGTFLVSVAFAAGLAAIQILPAAELAQHSSRSAYIAPRSVWEQFVEPSVTNGELVANPDMQPKLHANQIFDFSLAPWRLAELIWPNVAGRTYPIHSRWTQAALGEKHAWNPSLYVGLLPLVLAITAARYSRSTRQRWLMTIAALALFSSLGRIGGLYWAEVQLLPGYALFRYPSKWLALFSWSISLLAAAGWDQLGSRERRFARLVVIALSIITLLAWCALRLFRDEWFVMAQRAAPDRVFGPLDAARAWFDIHASLLQHLIVALLVLASFRSRWSMRPTVAGTLLLLTAAELTMAHQWQFVTVPDETLTTPSRAWHFIREDVFRSSDRDKDAPVRFLRDVGRPASWSQRSSSERMAEVVAWDRATLFPKHHLNHRRPSLVQAGARGSMIPVDRTTFMDLAKQSDHAAKIHSILGAYYFVTARTSEAADQSRLAEGAFLASAGEQWPRCWASFEYVRGPDVPLSARLHAWRRWALATIRATDDTHARPVVHGAANSMVTGRPGVARLVEAQCRDLSPNCVEVTVSMPAPGLLVLRDSYFPGWQATVRRAGQSRMVHVLRVNGVQRGVFLDSGNQRVVFRYRPRSFAAGMLISLVSWSVWCFILARVAIRHFRALFKLRLPAEPKVQMERKT